jgi:hypothetical protein
MVNISVPFITAEPRESSRCQFCDYEGSKLTDEHVWPGTLKDIFPPYANFPATATYNRGDTQLPNQTWQGPLFSATVRVDCGPCNNKHLERIEREAKPFLARMAYGLSVDLSLTMRRKLAAFGLRMVAVGQYLNESRPIPRYHREHLVQHRAPPPAVEVWLWKCTVQVPRVLGVYLHSLHIGAVPPFSAMPNGYRGLTRLGQLGIELAARIDGGPFPFVRGVVDSFVRIWPLDLSRSVVWPPRIQLTEAEWEARIREQDPSLSRTAPFWVPSQP